jgi:hypothetical protein
MNDSNLPSRQATHRLPNYINRAAFEPHDNRSALVPVEPATPIAADPRAHPAPEDGCLCRLDQPPISDAQAEPSELEPLSAFVANHPGSRCARSRRPWFPWASAGLYVAAQLVLAAAIGLGKMPTLGGIGLCFALLLCGLLLIGCQIMSEGPGRRGPTQ